MTAQVADIIWHEGKKRELFTFPLEAYFDNDNSWPEILDRLASTDCWRGYVAEWKIQGETLYLLDILDDDVDRHSIKNEVFSDMSQPVRATWFTGQLRIPDGEAYPPLHVDDMMRPACERDILLEIEMGVVLKKEIRDNRQIKFKEVFSDVKELMSTTDVETEFVRKGLRKLFRRSRQLPDQSE